MKKIDQVNLNIFFGYRCNYSCDNCTSGSDSVRTTELDPDFDKTIASVEKLAQMFTVSSMITLIGGEPFLYWDERIVPLVLECNKHFPNTRINVFTNGQLLSKYKEKIINLCNQVDNFSLSITRHLIAFPGAKVAKKWQENINDLINDSRIVKIHNDHYYLKNNTNANFYFFAGRAWRLFYKRLPDKTIKPFATNNPEQSMMHGCTGNVCSCVFEEKLYKCPTLAALPGHLKSLGQDNDADWEKYLNYPAVDIFNPDQAQYQMFVDTYGKPTTWCDMCNASPKNIVHWETRTYDKVFKIQSDQSL